MAKKKMLSIQCEIPGGFSEFVGYDSGVSLLDWDIILFKPDIFELIFSHTKTYQGKPSLSESTSFRLREKTEHWRREILDAFNAGKTVIVFLSKLEEVFVDTGQRSYSGTGRNRQTTVHVEPYTNYSSLPLTFDLVNSEGSSIVLSKHADMISSYWKNFAQDSSYKVLIDGKIGRPLLITKSASKPVGSIIQSKDHSGAIILLPHLDLDSEDFYEETDDGELLWTKKGKAFGDKLLKDILEIDKVLKQSSRISPVPDWAQSPEFDLPKEKKLNTQLLKIEKDIQRLLDKKEKAKSEIKDASLLKRLLYEKGKPLEKAIIEALTILGFKAEPYKDSDSEFDVIFESKEGRLLGEAEGKDSKAINIDKLRQLEMNIHEDFERDGVEEIAKGVLLGNANRLQPIAERGEYFTEKCLTAAKRNKTALICTPDLFAVSQYLSGTADKTFQKECRRAIFEANGSIVTFPKPPKSKAKDQIIKTTK